MAEFFKVQILSPSELREWGDPFFSRSGWFVLEASKVDEKTKFFRNFKICSNPFAAGVFPESVAFEILKTVRRHYPDARLCTSNFEEWIGATPAQS